MIVKERTIIADEGMILTNGTIYATKIRLGNWDSEDNYYEITKEEYDAILEAEDEII